MNTTSVWERTGEGKMSANLYALSLTFWTAFGIAASAVIAYLTQSWEFSLVLFLTAMGMSFAGIWISQATELQTRQELSTFFQENWSCLRPREQEALLIPAHDGSSALEDPVQEIALRDLTRKCLLVQTGGHTRTHPKPWLNLS